MAGVKRGLHLVTTQGRTAGHQLWSYLSTGKMATESVLETSVKLCILERPSAGQPFIDVCLILFLCDLHVSFPTRHNFWNIYIYRVSQEECARLREGVPYVKVYRITKNTYVQS